MKLNWKKPVREAKKVTDIIDIEEKEFDDIVNEFKKQLIEGKVTNNGELMEYAGKIAKTPEEAIVFASVFTSVTNQRRDPMEELMRMLGGAAPSINADYEEE